MMCVYGLPDLKKCGIICAYYGKFVVRVKKSCFVCEVLEMILTIHSYVNTGQVFIFTKNV